MASDVQLSHAEWRKKLSRMLRLKVVGDITEAEMNAEVAAFLNVYGDEEDAMFGRVTVIDVAAVPVPDADGDAREGGSDE